MSLHDDEQHRAWVLARLRKYLVHRRSPRAVLGWIMGATALAGFLSSMVMLRLGLDAMWLRYPLAVLVAWGVFLLFVRTWAERERDVIQLDEELGRPGMENPSVLPRRLEGVSNRERPWWDWFDISALGFDEGCFVGVLFLAALIAMGFAIVTLASLIAEADVLLAEVLLDAVLVSALYRRLNRLKPRWWLAGALRQTRQPVIATIVFLMALGLIVNYFDPGVKSIGGLWRQVRQSAR